MNTTKRGQGAKFTKQQIKNWELYEAQRLEGSYNMFDRRAIEASGLEREEYFFCLKNYDALRDAQGEGV